MIFLNNSKNIKKNKGSILLSVFIFSSLAIMVSLGFIGWAASSLKVSKRLVYREQAFQIAEAGVDYYRWHLAHSSTDFRDGSTTSSGPFTHIFYNKDGERIGYFDLEITPPTTGSTLVIVKSSGHVDADPAVTRRIKTQLAIPSFAKFAVVANADMRFGEGTITYGPLHSNGGIRFDGIAYNLITSARSSYDDPDHDDTGAEKLEYGVHTHVRVPPSTGVSDAYLSSEVPPPSAPNERPDVFVAGREFPVPTVDFTGITSDLSAIKTSAQSSGQYYGASGGLGYLIILKTNDTYDLYRVTNFTAAGSCNNSQSQTGWGTWSVRSNGRTLLGNYSFPSNGLIFLEDDVWVEGRIDGARLTIAAGRFPDTPSTRKSITVNNDLLYTNYDGSDVIGLISQKDFNVGMVSDDSLRIDAALIAQNGRAGRYYYGGCTHSAKTTITLYGMIATNQRYGFAYTDGNGYDERVIIYDANLLYAPPPSFPLTSDKYQTIGWEEVE